MGKQILQFLLLYLTNVCVSAKIQCGLYDSSVTCFGSGAYCCGALNDQCCWETYTVYSFWWFWVAWFWAFFLIAACTIWVCIRRRRRLANQRQYVIVDQQAPTYGAVSQPAWVFSGQQNASPPTAPPYQEKPPPYQQNV